MSIKKNRRYLSRAGFILTMLAAIPTFIWAVTSIMQGRYGEPVDNFKGQPLYPVISVIVLGTMMILLPIVYFNKDLRKKSNTK
ncbi:MAG: hypothetical protein AB7S78_09790 [Candidatus Omnitrophota bacterium]